ncbi:dynein axonemal light chain 1 [Phlebotomus argentipes]|uniref:dynein axonemal light chain 1 n=1 Tax=Phlebotomus argentipes TaxID=94469 RepID=UPI0028929CBD|nr:dynein axonemal light chain 1 [Phlebotomus argentipes]
MAKATTIKEALKRWEEKYKVNPVEAKDLELQFQWPPIERMDNTLGTLVACEFLSLSTNMIDKIYGLNGMKNLRVLSLGRNYIKQISGLECVSETLEELWLSYNLIEKLKGMNCLKNLRVLYLSNNLVKDWAEFNRLQECPSLENLLFIGNPLMETMEESLWRAEATKRLPLLKKLDGETVLREEEEQ